MSVRNENTTEFFCWKGHSKYMADLRISEKVTVLFYCKWRSHIVACLLVMTIHSWAALSKVLYFTCPAWKKTVYVNVLAILFNWILDPISWYIMISNVAPRKDYYILWVKIYIWFEDCCTETFRFLWEGAIAWMNPSTNTRHKLLLQGHKFGKISH